MCSIMGFTTDVLKPEEAKNFFDRTISRGPDSSRMVYFNNHCLCFRRLAIMGLDESGMQPFFLGENMVVCNGEIYGFRKAAADLED